MARGQTSCMSLKHVDAVLTWVMVALCSVHLCHTYSIDQIISRAMTKSHQGLEFDKEGKTVRVDLDMVFTVEDWNKLVNINTSSSSSNSGEGGHTLQKRQAILESAWRRYWPDGIVYYEVDHVQFSRRDIRVFQAAMEEWMRHTCVEFRPAPRNAHNKIVFVDGDGCASNVGMSRQLQPVTLARGCRTKGVVIHELGHVLGFNHEQARPDRDQYVKVRWENIPNYLEYNFRKYSWKVVRNLGVPYDYLSIMHYGKDSFTGNGRMTIETLDPKYQDLIGNRRGLSFRDIKSANIVYNCRPSGERCELQDEDCPGEGFVSKDCSCWCPTPDSYTHPDMAYYVCDPKVAPSSEDACEDENTNCEMWVQRGECSHNKAYMHTSCRKACGLCHSTKPQPPCRDEYSSCAIWKGKGYCGSSSPFSISITNKCRLTCGACQTTGPGPEGGKTSGCERQCHDERQQCQEWAARGECSATSDFMLRHCRKSCDACCTPRAPHSNPQQPQ